MSFDGLFTHAMVNELQFLSGGRLSKIHQPSDYEIILRIRANRQNYQLLLSAHPEFARLHLTEKKYDNPKKAPQFLMVLRKYIDRAEIKDIYQVDNDRIIIFSFERRDELGDLKSIYLVHEIMGRHSNIILTDKETVFDAIKHLSPAVNSYRTILPGSSYRPAPGQDKINPFKEDLSKEPFASIKEKAQKDIRKFIQSRYQGFSRLSAEELADRLVSSQENATDVYTQFLNGFDHIEPTITLKQTKRHFTAFPYRTLSGQEIQYDNLSEMLDEFYGKLAHRYQIKQKAGDLKQTVDSALSKSKRKLNKLEVEFKQTESADEYRVLGEVLTAYLHLVEAGMEKINLPNFYNNNQEIEIKLDPTVSPAANAQSYFSKYNKLKSRYEHLQREIPKTKEEIYYLENILAQLDYAEAEHLEEIRSELIREGYLKKQKQGNKKHKKSRPETFYAEDGTVILVGKNNQQNDELTMRTAYKSDWWLHTKDIPGSHVVIRSQNPSPETFNEAAILAAHFSKYAQSSSVPVDTTQIKHVRKPNGAKPGYVIYDHQSTLYVTPSQHIIDEMRKRNQKFDH